MIVKINKQKLIMEEVEQFDNISIEDLAEGACAARFGGAMVADGRSRASRERAALCRPLVRAQPFGRPQVVPARARQLGTGIERDEPSDSARQCIPGFPEHGA